MQVVYHLGAHFTDEDRLLKCLLKNRDTLAHQGIVVPGPGRYRALLREARNKLRGQPAPLALQEEMLDRILDDTDAGRVVFSNQTFLCIPPRVLRGGRLYADAGQKALALAQLFPQAQIEFFLAVRNPATFVPTVFHNSGETSLETFMDGADPRELRWSEVVRDLREANPEAEITVWSNEDTPLIWGQLLADLAGHEPQTMLDGIDDFVASLMAPEGFKRMQAYLAGHPPENEIQRRRVIAAFLDKYALTDEIEMELDMPGWTEDLVEDITELYEEDLFEIERMPGVTFITP
ncbi:hypothetical protein [Actibacterium sp. XHP0104]|uniref:hypothetical protein n=1 Tax=Actibacterium sp. XHP0104 TaxID=2984335 RepID=UPI0021E9849C|nr:hypothetical protein [Actibacterium sp. XHP0104]MCV2881380.1 hypothetical protein [Actibacterium sp. XHP0104]